MAWRGGATVRLPYGSVTAAMMVLRRPARTLSATAMRLFAAATIHCRRPLLRLRPELLVELRLWPLLKLLMVLRLRSRLELLMVFRRRPCLRTLEPLLGRVLVPLLGCVLEVLRRPAEIRLRTHGRPLMRGRASLHRLRAHRSTSLHRTPGVALARGPGRAIGTHRRGSMRGRSV